SPVLSAIGVTATHAESTLRISFGLQQNKKQVIQAANLLKDKVQLLRALSPLGEVNVY
ncbi:IscS subfamily cysteine desulfurase, partial [Francisella tularensis subsp. holarctica]|nr:IscS subfamily cysteine desulfurase [Francisella tularensis subsp. holarctica]